GESMPRQAAVGDEVISGCINMTGVLKIRTTREFGESTVSKILDLVENSSSKKSKSEKFISKFARVYTPAVCIAALAVALIPPIVRLLALGLDGDWKTWVYNALTFLVTSCPCAIVISIPLTFFAGIGGAGRDGILIKGSNYLETLSKVKTVVFDKTGTMTQGVFEVSGVHHSSLSDEHLLELAALVESRSTHPIARSIVHASCKYTCGGVCEHGCRHLDLSRVTDVEEIGGNGVVATVNIKGLPFADLIGSAAREGRAAETGTDTEAGTGTGTDAGASKGTDVIRVAVGNEKLMEKVGAAHVHCHMVGTIVHVAIDGAYAGHVVISDVIKPDAKQAIAELKKSGITRTVMLTGDSHKVAQSVAAELGIDEVESELLPADKVTKVEELLDANAAYPGRKLAFVGDGINDAPVLSRADIGIAMGALGSDAAIEAADVVLMDDSPLKISRAIRISRKCLRIVYENIYFAITIKILCLVLVPFGIVGMGAAIFADVGVMVLAVLNAIRALFVKRTAPSKRPVPLKTGQDA
ncbi:MAG: heavy metal translocating P-type ATPase, partial [Lachnospiraceae bacterium]|nr:heavy metal translocating P-type ATPase [Lachnospiraceae bacterium]